MDPLILGWRERVALPELGVESIKAKVDTGAASSSIDAADVFTYSDAQGQDRARFTIRLGPKKTLECDAPIVGVRTIRNPGRGGREERRYVIRTTLEVNGTSWPIEVNLARRTRMRYRMLLGRQALAGRCLVDPDRSFILGRRP